MAISDKDIARDGVVDQGTPTEDDHRGKSHFSLDGAAGADISFRPSRYTPDQLQVQSATARFADMDDHINECTLVNVSSSGVAFELPAGEVIRNGQIIESFTASFDDVPIYSGRVNVINQRTVGDTTIVGVAFYDEYLVPDKLDRASKLASTKRKIESRLARIDQIISGSIDERVKVVVADFSIFLSGIRDVFDSHVPANASHDFEIGVIKAVEAQAGEKFHDFIHRLHIINEDIPDEHASAVADYMKQHIKELLLPAPIYRQSYYKPLGYAGDYLTMNIAYTNHYQGESAYAKFLNRMFCQLVISRAAIARVPYIKGWIDKTVAEREGGSVSIMSVASGPAREVQDYLNENNPEPAVLFHLFDQDPEALAFAQSQISPVARRFGDHVKVRYVNGAVKHLVKDPRRFDSLGNQDLIYTAGLFDYLETKPAAMLLKNLFDLLAPGGRLIIGNLAPSCDSKGFLENIVDWKIIYRTDDQLRELTALIEPKNIDFGFEETRVNRFLVVER